MTALPAKVLVIADDPTTSRRLAEMLRAPGIDVWVGPAEIPSRESPEVVVIGSDGLSAPWRGSDEGQSDALGVVRIGGNGPADVCLAEDVSDRELQLACRLLSEVVRLRRQQRSGAELHRRLTREAMTDPLTGLPNRRAWEQAITDRLAESTGQHRLCLAILDLDHFKRVNDTHGHAAGDEVLRAVGGALSGSLRSGDFVARLGGDEFALLLAVPDAVTAKTVIDRVRRHVPAALADAALPVVSASAGFHVPRQRDDAVGELLTPEEVVAAADAALREAKRQGRDRAVGDDSA